MAPLTWTRFTPGQTWFTHVTRNLAGLVGACTRSRFASSSLSASAPPPPVCLGRSAIPIPTEQVALHSSPEYACLSLVLPPIRDTYTLPNISTLPYTIMNQTQTLPFIEANKEKCATPTCPRINLAKACTRHLCSKCCHALLTPCGYAKHQEKRTAQHVAHLSAAANRHAPPMLARPPPIHVPQDPQLFTPQVPAGSSVQEEVVEGRSFEKSMYESFRSLWDQRVAQQQADAKAEQQRRDNQTALARSIDLLYWREVRSSLDMCLTIIS